MKRYLYEIDLNGVHIQGIPFMPKVLAERTVRAIKKAEIMVEGRANDWTVSKTTLTTKTPSPMGKINLHPSKAFNRNARRELSNA